jgi:hypothetical protein
VPTKKSSKGDWTQLSMPLPSDPGRHIPMVAPAPSFSVDAWRILRLFCHQTFDRPPSTHAIAGLLGMSPGDAATACSQLAPYGLLRPVTYRDPRTGQDGRRREFLAQGWQAAGKYRSAFNDWGIAALARAET